MLVGRLLGGVSAMSSPPMMIWPSVGVSRPEIMRSKRGLAAARRAEQREELVLGNVDVDIVDGNDAAWKFLADVANGYDWVCHAQPLPDFSGA